MNNLEEITRKTFLKKAEVIDNFCKMFLVKNFDSPELVNPKDFELVVTQGLNGSSITTSYELVLIDLEERERLKERLVVREALKEEREEVLEMMIESADMSTGEFSHRYRSKYM